MWRVGENDILSPVATCETFEAYNAPRQALPKVYIQNACIDVVKSKTILDQHSMSGKQIGGYIQEIDFDIDSEADFVKAEQYLELLDLINTGKKLTICFDIDGVIAQKAENNDYTKALPNYTSIGIVNKLFTSGHHIILFTARGSFTGIDWETTTRDQLAGWGVFFTELRFGKPTADIYIDDRLLSIDQLLNFSKYMETK